jgi:hypothetical protein
MGFLGALLYVLVWSSSLKDLWSYSSLRHLLVGLIVGYIYSVLHSEYSFPNSVMAAVAGYMGPDFAAGLIEKLKPKIGGSK